MSVQERFREFRLAMGWSRAEMAERLERSESMIGHVETGRRGVGLGLALAIQRESLLWDDGPIRADEWLEEAA